MKSIKLITAFLLFLVIVSKAQIKNSRIQELKVFGNCAMCENVIESVGTKKYISKVDWDVNSKIATVDYDTNKTTLDRILKDIALAGYDNELFLAPELAYEKLPECCKYDRPIKRNNLTETSHVNQHASEKVEVQTNEIQVLFDNYILLKDALVKSNSKDAALIAQSFQKLVSSIQMGKLDNDVHMVYMKYVNDLNKNAGQIVFNESKIDIQRENFEKISLAMYQLVKVAKLKEPIYYKFCPMYNDGKGATWLSKDLPIKNPYYGSQMLTCGKVLETLK
jgi:copper chaperone CopZ